METESNSEVCCGGAAGLGPGSPAAATLQPLPPSTSLPGSRDPLLLLLLDHVLIDSCHTCRPSLGMVSAFEPSLAGDTSRTLFRSRNGRLSEVGGKRLSTAVIANPGVCVQK